MQSRYEQDESPRLDAKVVEKLSSRRAAWREGAAATIDRLGPEAVDALIALMRAESAKRARRRRIAFGILAVYVLLIGIAAISHHGGSVGSFSSLISTFAAMLAATQAQKNAAGALAKYDDLRAIGPLAEALEFGDKSVAAIAERKLIEMMPRLKASDAALLEDPQRRILDRQLVKHRNPALVLAVLGALEQVGDGTALAAVRRLADGEGRTGRDRRVQAAAAACVPYLQRRADTELAEQTLLRPVLSADAGGTLLRPASGAPDADPDTLLRPASPAPDAGPVAPPADPPA